MVNQSCGSSKIAGVSFSIHPMSDDFVKIITDALDNVDTSKVWVKTDKVSTTIRGKLTHIFDVSKAMFLHAAKTGVHVAFQATYSFGCPGDSEGDVYMAEDDVLMNKNATQSIKQPIAAKFSLYPLGGGDYMDVIYKQIEEIKKIVSVSRVHYSTYLEGDANKVFDGLENVFQATIQGGSSHTVMTVSISANSPSVY